MTLASFHFPLCPFLKIYLKISRIIKHKRLYKFHFHWQWSRRPPDCGKIHFGKSNKTSNMSEHKLVLSKLSQMALHNGSKNNKMKHDMRQTFSDPLLVMNLNFQYIFKAIVSIENNYLHLKRISKFPI